ncbi:MAG: hypothetical protein KGI06_01510 [Candidatus Micrarchaeota archaeon]|nr:hypothetical protein [Candidatus Micrarchaeota archaeon]
MENEIVQSIVRDAAHARSANLRDLFRSRVRSADSLQEVKEGIIEVLMGLNNRERARIGFVSGIITSDGEESIGRNTEVLDDFTSALKNSVSFGVFSQVDVFDYELASRMRGRSCRDDWQELWRGVLGSSCVTDIFMTPRWEKSCGSVDEYKTAIGMGINIFHVYRHHLTNELHIVRK